MATDTTARHCIVIHAHQRRPLRGRMAFLAHGKRLDMAGRNDFGGQPAAGAMTHAALCWRTLENASHMACGTVRILVRTIQGKSGRQMIKHSGLIGRSGRRTCKQQQHSHANKQQPGLQRHSPESGMICCVTCYLVHISPITKVLPDLDLIE